MQIAGRQLTRRGVIVAIVSTVLCAAVGVVAGLFVDFVMTYAESGYTLDYPNWEGGLAGGAVAGVPAGIPGGILPRSPWVLVATVALGATIGLALSVSFEGLN